MKMVLGLDLGTNSIGWALVGIDENGIPVKIIAMGSRIIPLTSDDRDEFLKGQSISKNQKRTIARTQRKGYGRKQLKKSDNFKYSLKKLLKKHNIYPTGELLNLPRLDLWKLRSEAANKDKNISAEQLGRILYMLNQKRGYKSVRSEANLDKKDTEYVAEIKGRYMQLKERSQTIGQYFYDELKNAAENDTYFRIKEKIYPREAYIEEFDMIINTNKDKFDFLTEEVIHQLRNEIIYYQRKLKSQKGLVSVCELERFEIAYKDKETQKEKIKFVGPKVAPKTSPLFQLSKIWETVNNISLKIKKPEGSKYKWGDKILTLEEKQKIADYLFHNENLSFAKLLEILNLKKEDVYVNKQILKGIQGNITYAMLYNIIGDSEYLSFNISVIPSKHEALLVDKKTGEIIKEKKALQLDASVEREPLYQLWHTVYSIKDLTECKNALIKRFGFKEDIADKLSRLDFNKQAFGNKSNKAIRKTLPYLMQGYDYSQACSFAGYNHSNSLTKDEQQQQQTGDKLELLSKNRLRQPVVEKILNQMINVVNTILEKYGKPCEIRVELARELKQSKDERNEADKRNIDNKKLNDEIVKRLTGLGLPTTKRFVQKYKFIFPSNGKSLKEAQVVNQCIYCGEPFNLTEALNGDNFDIDHIVPKDLLFDDSQTNKVLVHRKCNATKTNHTAYDYIAQKGSEQLQQYVERVDDWYKRGVISFSKMQRLKVSYEEYLERKKQKKETEADKKLWENFIDRQLRESQYIARKSKEILGKISNNITTTEGGVTSKLRELWGWNDVLMNLQMPKYKELEEKTGQKYIEVKEWISEHGTRKHTKKEIINWSKRDDHRHHAIDALVIACTKQGFIQRINTLNASEVKDEMKREVEQAKIDYNERLTLLEKYLVSQKPFMASEVMKEAEKILVSFKAGKKVVTVSKYKGKGKNKNTGVIVPRGALHEQGLYGKIKILKKGNIVEEHIIKKYKVGVSAQDHIFTGKETFSEKFDKNGNKKIDDKIAIALEAIVDKKVREIVLERLNRGFDEGKDYRSSVKKALENFKNLENDPLWYNKEKGIPILSIKMKTGLKDSVIPIRSDETGKEITYVKTGNNHHIAIYTNENNNLIQHLCTFWHAVERKKHQIPYIIKDTKMIWDSLIYRELPQSFLSKLPADGLKLKYSMQQNEMFILGLSNEEFEEAIKNDDKPFLSKYLYLVWSISYNDYYFRHHLETKNTELKSTEGAKESKRYYRFKSISAINTLNPIKVRINHIGEIVKWENN